MRISKQSLVFRWAVTAVLGGIVCAILSWSDLRLKALSGFGTADLQSFSTAAQYRQAFALWPSFYAVRAGFNLGLDYLLMPLYAAAFFYSGILTREAFAPRPGRLRRILTLLAAVPIAGAVLDAAENALQLTMMLSGATDSLARIAFTISNAKWMAIYVGLALLLGAVLARQQERQQARLRASKGAG
jgi:DMSO/TMAO reductase YedYZ heme-binding membrane subunit